VTTQPESPPNLDFDALVQAIAGSRYQWVRLDDAVDMATNTARTLADAGAVAITINGEPFDTHRSVGALRRLVSARRLLDDEAEHDPAGPFPYPLAVAITASVCIATDALHLIDQHGCTTFTRGRCLDATSGKKRGAKYGADKWCDACVARDALNRIAEESSS
jgi:hypothetical protein